MLSRSRIQKGIIIAAMLALVVAAAVVFQFKIQDPLILGPLFGGIAFVALLLEGLNWWRWQGFSNENQREMPKIASASLGKALPKAIQQRLLGEHCKMDSWKKMTSEEKAIQRLLVPRYEKDIQEWGHVSSESIKLVASQNKHLKTYFLSPTKELIEESKIYEVQGRDPEERIVEEVKEFYGRNARGFSDFLLGFLRIEVFAHTSLVKRALQQYGVNSLNELLLKGDEKNKKPVPSPFNELGSLLKDQTSILIFSFPSTLEDMLDMHICVDWRNNKTDSGSDLSAVYDPDKPPADSKVAQQVEALRTYEPFGVQFSLRIQKTEQPETSYRLIQSAFKILYVPKSYRQKQEECFSFCAKEIQTLIKTEGPGPTSPSAPSRS